jgi:pyridoxal 5'-phosphate synthase pdxT subunit
MTTIVGVLALQGAFLEHIVLLRKAAAALQEDHWHFIEVRNTNDLARCRALVIPGGESTTISFVAAQSEILEPLRQFVKYVTSAAFPSLALTVSGSIETQHGGPVLA